MRHTIRQARVCIVNKLTKQIKQLQNRHGNEIQQEKCKKKADKFIAEIHALKKIKNDSIYKFGILNERNITEILQDQSLSNSDHIIARIAHYKTVHEKIMQFKEKFPDYRRYLTENRKQSKKLKVETKNRNFSYDLSKGDENVEKQKHPVDKTIRNFQDNFEDVERNHDVPKVKNISQKHKKSLDTISEKDKITERKENNTLDNKVIIKQPNITKLCSVTKEAMIREFTTELVQQDSDEDMQAAKEDTQVSNEDMQISNEDIQASVENRDLTDTAVMQEEIIDDFFITKDNQENYKTNYVSTSTSNTRYREHNTRSETFSSYNRFTKQNAKYNNTKFNKNQRYNEPKYKSNIRNDNQNKKYLTKEPNKTNIDTNKNNLNNVNKMEENLDLHPSWLVKKKEKEIMKQGFQGKKIVFNFD
jgi:hypothetical protein